MPSDLENAMLSLMAIFHKYSEKEGSKGSLSNSELKDLFKGELGCFLKNQKDEKAVDKIMADLDHNGDGTVDFQEFAILVISLTIACHEQFQKS
uniref:Protein S100 n=3 Tax=Callorhinchus milii TaxID=7868 RepID=A0A4W3H569_CALMI|eukprot:gi/632962047/ref/XP_007897094.1/ PREDICTED: protein S100-A1-like [Callorhinchus milii]